jgi:CRISPR-associated protein Csm4
MYKDYRLRIKPLSTFITPWQSDTFVGHLFWAVRYIEGEEYLKGFIKDSKEFKPPFIFSDGIIRGQLPKPDYPTLKRSQLIKLGREYFGENSYTALKKVKKINTIKEEEFREYIKGCDGATFIKNKLISLKNSKSNESKNPIKTLNITHNTINRITGTTTDGDLFSTVEYLVDGEILFYIKMRKDLEIESLKKYIEYVALTGFGKKSSSGKGAFEIVSLEENQAFNLENSNAFMVLSNYIPKNGDYEEALSVKTITKFGKVGGNEEDMPFKKPFICFEKGSIFKGNAADIKGKILEGVHYDKSIVQFGIPYTVEVRVDE